MELLLDLLLERWIQGLSVAGMPVYFGRGRRLSLLLRVLVRAHAVLLGEDSGKNAPPAGVPASSSGAAAQGVPTSRHAVID
ncbi:MAG TPA: hypothetical protein VFB58_09330 [Chloroflexota bacterium]|nr:hypothetical protein [Chloroflexota bacterium]